MLDRNVSWPGGDDKAATRKKWQWRVSVERKAEAQAHVGGGRWDEDGTIQRYFDSSLESTRVVTETSSLTPHKEGSGGQIGTAQLHREASINYPVLQGGEKMIQKRKRKKTAPFTARCNSQNQRHRRSEIKNLGEENPKAAVHKSSNWRTNNIL